MKHLAQKTTRRIGLMSLFLLAALLFLQTSMVSAQTTNPTDGATPLALSPGTPAGSYQLSGFENVNLYNGGLNFSLPLYQIAGRGDAGYPVLLQIEQKWTVDKVPPAHLQPTVYLPKPAWWNEETEFRRSYSMGHLDMRKAVGTDFNIWSGNGYVYYSTLTRLTFTAPGGTEYELRDKLSNGQPDNPWSRYPVLTPFNRGKVFVTADGTAATFISDTDIVDEVSGNDSTLLVSGDMLLSDGTHYRIDSGLISSMRDRNGNQLNFEYDFQRRLSAVTDSLNRRVSITYASISTGYDEITYLRSGNVTRSIKVYVTAFSADCLRSDFTLQTEQTLFPGLNGAHSVQPSVTVVTAIELPNGKQYQLKYNNAGEVARVVLPTGGAIEYDYDAGLADGTANGVLSKTTGIPEKHIYRRVTERRVYPDGGSGPNYETRTTYSRPESNFTGTSTTNEGYVRVETLDINGHRLELSDHYFYGSPTLSLFQKPTEYPAYKDGREYRTDVYDADGQTVLRSVENTFTQDAVAWWNPNSPETAPPNNTHLTETKTTIEPAGANLVTKQTFAYDQFSNRTDVYEYDYGQGAAPSAWARHSHTDYLTTLNNVDYASPSPTASSIHIRNLPTQQSVYDANGAEKARTTFEYDVYAGTNHASLVPRSSISRLDSAYTASYLYRGNVTAISRWLLDQTSTALTTYQQYDVAGNMVKAIDARGYVTTIGYADDYGAADGEARTSAAPPELSSVSKQSYAYPTTVTNALGYTSYAQFDYYLGKPVDAEDVNGVVASGYYADVLDRPTRVVRAANELSASSVRNQTAFSYDDNNRIVTVTSDQASFNDNALKSQTVYDKMGRTVETRTYENSTQYIAARQTPFLVLQDPETNQFVAASQSSNPFRPYLLEQPVFTTIFKDALGRPYKVQTPDNAIVRTSYSGSSVTVTDQAGKMRRSVVNGLGQLVRVDEPDSTGSLGSTTAPNQPTGYTYDVMGNLTQVRQGGQLQSNGQYVGGQTRTFAYSSLSRLTSAMNPESGIISYEYDANGNLTQKTDARSITTTYEYDELNRIETRSYSDTTPAVTYSYDTATNGKGRLASVSSSVSAYNYTSYDALGGVTASSQVTDGVTYSMPEYKYNLAGSLTSEKYPSGKVVETKYDAAGRVAGVKNQATEPYYVGGAADSNLIRYTAHGAVKDMRLGNGLWEHAIYNIRLQPALIGLGTTQCTDHDECWDRFRVDYSYGPQDNGNIAIQTISVPDAAGHVVAQMTQVYDYDELNRLKSAVEVSGTTQNWKQTFSYDRYGNRRFNQGQDAQGQPLTTLPAINTSNQTITNPQISGSNNRISDTGYRYDAAGNLECDPTRICNPTTQAPYYEYDAENKLVRNGGGASPNNATAASYFYDGDGRRVKKAVGSGYTIFVYDVMGQMVAEYDTGGASGSGTSYLTEDNLGTPRIITGADGSVKARHDYLPFGEEIGLNGGRTGDQCYGGSSDKVRQKFTGYERDEETNLDFAQARMFNSSMGRFTSPDPYKIVAEIKYEKDKERARNKLNKYLQQPQHWNSYAYSINNPLKYTDPTGEEIWLRGSDDEIQKALRLIGEILGPERFKYLKLFNHNGPDGKALVLNIDTKDVEEFSKIGDDKDNRTLSKGMAKLLSTSQVIETRVDGMFNNLQGKLASVEWWSATGAGTMPANFSSRGNIQVVMSPESAYRGNNIDTSKLSNDGGRLEFTDPIVLAHELGHAWDMVKSERGDDGALAFENAMRSRIPNNTRRRLAEQ